MNDLMKYREYSAIIKFDSECNLFRAEVVDINDLITFHGDSVQALDRAFKDAIDDYLEHCKEIGRTPEKPYSGKISLRMSPGLHKRTARRASEHGKSINAFIVSCIERELDVHVIYKKEKKQWMSLFGSVYERQPEHFSEKVGWMGATIQ